MLLEIKHDLWIKPKCRSKNWFWRKHLEHISSLLGKGSLFNHSRCFCIDYLHIYLQGLWPRRARNKDCKSVVSSEHFCHRRLTDRTRNSSSLRAINSSKRIMSYVEHYLQHNFGNAALWNTIAFCICLSNLCLHAQWHLTWQNEILKGGVFADIWKIWLYKQSI